MDHIKEGFNAFNEPIFLFFDADGITNDGKACWWIENHATDFISEPVYTEGEGIALFDAAVANAHRSEYR